LHLFQYDSMCWVCTPVPGSTKFKEWFTVRCWRPNCCWMPWYACHWSEWMMLPGRITPITEDQYRVNIRKNEATRNKKLTFCMESSLNGWDRRRIPSPCSTGNGRPCSETQNQKLKEVSIIYLGKIVERRIIALL
jgi:hypothetical protein